MTIKHVTSHGTNTYLFDSLHLGVVLHLKYAKGGALYVVGNDIELELTTDLLFSLISKKMKEKKCDN